jgi:hypothetical protein
MAENSELETKAEAKPFDRDRYWSGVFTGVFLGCFIITALLVFAVRLRGLTVAIDPDRLAGVAQVRVAAEAKRSLPQVLEGIKQELPEKIDANLSGLDDLNISIGKTQVKLPDEAISAMKSEFNRIIEEAVINTLNNYNTAPYEEKLGKNTYELFDNMLRQEVIGKTYLLQASQWFSLPVKIVGSSKRTPAPNS